MWLAGAGRDANEKADVKPPMRQPTSLSRLLIGFSMEPCTGIQSRRKKRGCLDSDTHTTDEGKQHDRDLNPALQPQGAVATESKAIKQGRREHNSKIWVQSGEEKLPMLFRLEPVDAYAERLEDGKGFPQRL